MGAAQAGAVIGVDTGRTFTDVILLDPMNGRIVTAKTPSHRAALSPASAVRSIKRGIADAAIHGYCTGPRSQPT